MSDKKKHTCEECEHSQTCNDNDTELQDQIDRQLAELFFALMNKNSETANKIAEGLNLPKDTIKDMLAEVEKNPDLYTTFAILETLGFTIAAERNNIRIPLNIFDSEAEESQDK